MTSRLGLALGLLGASSAGACLQDADDLTIIEVGVSAGVSIQLVPPPEPVPVDAVAYRWEISSAPKVSNAVAPPPASIGIFIPDARGEFWVDRWVVLGLGEALSHRFIVRAFPAAPVAVATPERSTVTIGEIVRVDASMSYSPENLPLQYKWEVRSSPSSLGGQFPSTNSLVSFYAAAAGTYSLRLTVADSQGGSGWVDVNILSTP